MSSEVRSKPGRKKIRKDDEKCLVCGGKSIGFNFGVPSCSPCKAFFRRNAVKLGVCCYVMYEIHLFTLTVLL